MRTGSDAAQIVLTIPSESRYLRFARSAVESLAGSLDVAAGRVLDVVLVANELVTNSVLHGAGDRVRLEVSTDRNELTLRASNEGEASDIAPIEQWRMPAASAPSGRGLGIVRALCRSVAVTEGDGWVTVECRIPLHGVPMP